MLKKWMLNCLLLTAAVIPAFGKDLKVLMIGNSFSVCVGVSLPSIVNSVPGHSLELTSAYIAGCPLEKHAANLKKAETDPDFKPYLITFWTSVPPLKAKKFYKGNVNELLKNNQYDVITIQQSSGKSWNYATYQPFAEEVIAYVRKHQPKAEIVIQQTWSYRCDHVGLQPHPKAWWKFDQTGMYERLREAYKQLAQATQFRVIPMGDAVQLFRKYTPVKFQPEMKELKDFKYPEAPSNAGDVVGRIYWKKDPKTGEQKLIADRIHLNPDGNYLQACLWFGFLYGEPVGKIKFAPEGMKPDLKELLQKCAQEALDKYVQVKK